MEEIYQLNRLYYVALRMRPVLPVFGWGGAGFAGFRTGQVYSSRWVK
jgi:hypothetical protein